MILKIRIAAFISLLLATLYAFGVLQTDGINLFEFVRDAAHITTARALMNFQFFWSDIPALGVSHDVQFYNGAIFPNSGYGVALLQIPFHFIWNLFSNSDKFTPFPDRLIFLFYCVPVIYFIYYSILTLLAKINFAKPLHKELLAFAATLALTVQSIYYVMSMYFCVYESNTAYFLLFEILACLSCLHYRRAPALRWLRLAGLGAGIALLIRPTGLVLLAFWLCALILPTIQIQAIRKLKVFFISLAPFLAYFFISNYVRAGGFFATGFNNVIPLIPELHTLRFDGNPCFVGLSSFLSFFGVLVKNIFGTWNGHGDFYINNLPTQFNNCGLIFESADQTLMRAPFIPLVISLGAAAIIFYQFINKRRWDILLAGATIFALLIAYTLRQSGFGARYVADFWPLFYYIWLAAIPVKLESVLPKKYIWAAIIFLFATSTWTLTNYTSAIIKQRECVATSARAQHVNPAVFHREGRAFKLNRYRYREGEVIDYNAALAAPMPVSTKRVSTELGVINLIQDKTGWAADGQVDSISHFFILAPNKAGDTFELVLTTSNIALREIQIYLNGKVVKVQAQGTETRATFHIDQTKLFSPMLDVAIEWERSFGQPDIKLYSAELR